VAAHDADDLPVAHELGEGIGDGVVVNRLQQSGKDVGMTQSVAVPAVGKGVGGGGITGGEIGIQLVRGVKPRPVGADRRGVGVIGEDDSAVGAQVRVECGGEGAAEDDEFTEVGAAVEAVVVRQVEVLQAQTRGGKAVGEGGVEFLDRLDFHAGWRVMTAGHGVAC
jgi:hypothetical protein